MDEENIEIVETIAQFGDEAIKELSNNKGDD